MSDDKVEIYGGNGRMYLEEEFDGSFSITILDGMESWKQDLGTLKDLNHNDLIFIAKKLETFAKFKQVVNNES